MRSGDRVSFEFEEDSVRLRVERRRSLEELKGSLPATREIRARRPRGERRASTRPKRC